MTTLPERVVGSAASSFSPTAPVLARVASWLTLASTATHVLLLDVASLGSLVMVGLALVCLPCAWHLWRRPTASVWVLTAVTDLTMLLLHLQMLGERAASADMPGMAMGGRSGSHWALMWVTLVLLLAQLTLAAVVAGRTALRR